MTESLCLPVNTVGGADLNIVDNIRALRHICKTKNSGLPLVCFFSIEVTLTVGWAMNCFLIMG